MTPTVHHSNHGFKLRAFIPMWLVGALGVSLGSTAAASESGTPSPQVAGIQCDSMPACLKIFEDPRIAPLDAFPAKFFLDAHADQTTVERIARMLREPNQRLRERASWFLSTRKDRWPTQVEDWKADVRAEPSDAFHVADIPGEASYAALLDLAKEDLSDEEPIGYALSRFDKGKRVQQIGKALILCASPCPYRQRDALLVGLYSDFYVEPDVDSVRQQLLGMASNPSFADESRRLAFFAYVATIGSVGDPDYSALKKLFAAASPLLRHQLSTAYPRQLGGGSEIVPAVVASIDSEPSRAFLTLLKIGPDAAAASPQLEKLMRNEDASMRWNASDVLFMIDRPSWRKQVDSLARDGDPMIAMDTLETASDDSAASFSVAKSAANSYWFPGLRVAADKISFHSKPYSQPPPADTTKDRIEVSDFWRYMKPLAELCPALPDDPSSVLGLPSLTDQHIDKGKAFAETDVTDAYLSAVFKTADGWLIGTEDGEFGGKLLFAPTGKSSRLILHSAFAISTIFRWRGDMYAIIGGPYAIHDSGFWPELVRLHWNGDSYRPTVVTDFPAVITGIYGDSTRLVFLLERSGFVELTDLKHPHWIGCKTE